MGKATRDRGGLGLLTLSSQVAACYLLLCEIIDLGAAKNTRLVYCERDLQVDRLLHLLRVGIYERALAKVKG